MIWYNIGVVREVVVMNSFINLLTGEIYNCTWHWEACDYFYKEALEINRLDLYASNKIKRLK